MEHRRRHRRPLDTRERMIAETEAFLSWAMRQDRDREHPLPRIPRRRVDQGGYASLLGRPGARAAVVHWWRRALSQVI